MVTDPSSNSEEGHVEKELTFPTLRNLLQVKDWRKADYETCQIITQSDWRNPSKEVLRTLDRLWLEFSDGCFGFGIQQKIYFECGGEPGDLIYITQGYDQSWYHSTWVKFAKRIGWKGEGPHWVKYEDLTFDVSACQGHLPCFGGAYNHYVNHGCGGGGRFYPMALFCFLGF